MKTFLSGLLWIALLSTSLGAENWPQWRGSLANGVATPGQYPREFSSSHNIQWKIELPGRGTSTPAVWEQKIFVTCPIDDRDGVLCFDFEGQELWRHQLGPERPGKHRNGSGCNPSPVTDGQYLVTYYKSGTVACFDLAGKLLWQRNLQQQYGADTLWWDLATSPVLAAGNAVIAVMQEGESYLVALKLDSGEVAWYQPRNYDRPVESDQSYTTPHVVEQDSREVIVTWGADHLTGHDAETGKQLWSCGGFNPDNQRAWRPIASAVVDDRGAIVPYGRGKMLAAISFAHANGDITSTHRQWERADLGAEVPTPVLDGERFLLLTDRGEVHCLDRSTGEELWSAPLPRARDKYYSSPVLAGNTLYCAREDGIIMAATVANGLEDIVQNEMGESIVATPIPIRGKLLVRGPQHLFMIQ